MSEIIVKLTDSRIKLKGGEYVRDVVRCKDCKYDHKCSHNIIRPSKSGGIIYCPLEYCSEGERKES